LFKFFKLPDMKTLLRNIIFSIFIITVTAGYSFGQIRIAVSKTSGSYEAWLHGADPDAVIVNMYGMTVDSALFVLSTCHGLLLTGGEDVNPVYYDKVNELSKCEEIDNYRDSLELALINRALLVRMPIFGICRGEQILNVALGGTLLTDIPTDVGKQVAHRCPPGSQDCLHSVKVDQQSELYQLTGVENGMVNSYHHQAVDMIAPGMRVSASSENGVAEAIEREMPLGKSFIMGVQWHPEALSINPGLSKPLADNFLEQVGKFKQDRRHCCGAY
jgi:putative glutamine amidotransferase